MLAAADAIGSVVDVTSGNLGKKAVSAIRTASKGKNTAAKAEKAGDAANAAKSKTEVVKDTKDSQSSGDPKNSGGNNQKDAKPGEVTANSGDKGVAKGIPDSTIVCRGGTCKADLFTEGNGVSTDAAGKLSGVSTGIGDSIEAATTKIPHKKVGVSTAGDIRKAGGAVVNDHGNHANVSGITAEQAAELFKNVVKNPNK